jgi:hypothetical protein
MPDQDPRTCPVCSLSFTPKRINSVTCTPKCGKRAEHLRAKAKAYNADQRNITAATLRTALMVLEADAEVSAKVTANNSIRCLDGELEDEAEVTLLRDKEAHILSVQRQWAKSMGEALQRRRESGWRPLGLSPSPFKGMAKAIILTTPCKPVEGPKHAP